MTWTKIFSGKFLFTVITAFVFAYAVYAKILNSEQTYGVIMLVVAFYFSKSTGEDQIKGELNEKTTVSTVSTVGPNPPGSVTS